MKTSSSRMWRHRNPQQNAVVQNESSEKASPFFAHGKVQTKQDTAFFQTKLTIGKADDPYEREADAVADKVVNNTKGQTAASTASGFASSKVQTKEIGAIQRLATPEEDKMPATNDARMAEDKRIQEKPMIQKMDAPKEEEKPAVQKMDAPKEEEKPAVQKMDAPKEEEKPAVQKMDAPKEEEKPAVQKMDAPKEEEKEVPSVQKAEKPEEEEPVQAKSKGGETTASAGFTAKVGQQQGQGHRLSGGTKARMESGFGRDFSGVTIHTDAESAALNRDIGAQAFTHGKDIYFNEGRFNPQNREGTHLLAHELTHVVQQGQSQEIRRDPTEEVDLFATIRKQRIQGLKSAIEMKFQQATYLKRMLKPESSVENDQIIAALNATRGELVVLLEKRVALIQESLSKYAVCNAETAELETELMLSQQWLFPLTRWQKRKEIEQINDNIAAINQQLSQFNTCDDQTEPLFVQLEVLKKRRKTLAKSLTSTAIEYKQFDARWGSQRYGNAASCTSVAEAACGPTSLAMVLNFYELENPEGAVLGGNMEVIQPTETVNYAKDHGRYCNTGTAGDPMMSGVNAQWEKYRGRAITLTEVKTELENGKLVIFLCKNCEGKNAKGVKQTYGGHYMVLNGVDDAGTIFTVLDSGRREEKNIETIDLTNLKTKVSGFWTVDYVE